jgi:hypothetical protein
MKYLDFLAKHYDDLENQIHSFAVDSIIIEDQLKNSTDAKKIEDMTKALQMIEL